MTMSKTRLFRSIKALDVEAVTSLIEAHPDLLRRDKTCFTLLSRGAAAPS